MSKEIQFEKSFASNEKSKYWSNKNKLKPIEVSKSSNKKYLFNCNLCNHEFESSLNDIVSGSWCSYCGNHSKKLCSIDECKMCFEKSFASHNKFICWSIENKLKPREVFKKSKKIYLFDCDKCYHSFESRLEHINNGHWCPYCVNQKLCKNNDCKICFEKSFASHNKSVYWSNKNINKPRDVFMSSGNKYCFDCNKCNNTFESSLDHIKQGKWCSYCLYKTETKLYEKLKEKYCSLIHQYKVKWCKNKKYLPYDFVIPEHKIIIELDGLQHFQQVGNWKSPQENLIRDKYKEDCANNNGYSIIRILQDDVYNDRFEWLNELDENIQKIINDKQIQNIYICKLNEYNLFK